VLGAYLVCVLLLLVYLEHRPVTRQAAEPPSAASDASFPAPPPGAVVFSRQAGRNALALGLVPRPGGVLRAQVSVVGPDGAGVRNLSPVVRVDRSTAAAEACGAGCYRATLRMRARPRVAEVALTGSSTTRWRIVLPGVWPPPDATRMVASSRRAWRSLRSLAYSERLAADERHVLRSVWRAQAPDRLAYRITGGASAIVVGSRRWDKEPGGRWRPSSQTRLTEPTPTWLAQRNARVLGPATVHGERAVRVSFFDPELPAWFTVLLERKTLRTLDLRMVTTAHFMHEAFHSFDAAPPIRPPRR
jgi:hypothetical protein